jgi:hypothetical protein
VHVLALRLRRLYSSDSAFTAACLLALGLLGTLAGITMQVMA